MNGRLYFKQIEMGPMQNFVYLIGSTETRKVAVVDGAWGIDEILRIDIIKAESGDKIDVGGVEIQLLHTPGHTPGSQCFLIDNRIVSGDTLFIGSCGRVDLPGSNPEQMYYSLTQKLMALPDDTLLFPW